MKIHGIIWLEDIVEKMERKHAVSQQEVVEVLAGSPRYRFVEKGIWRAKMSTPVSVRRKLDVF